MLPFRQRAQSPQATRSSKSRPPQNELFEQAPCAEALEARLMLAGVVKVSVNRAGDISIRGDGNDNYVEVAPIDTNGDDINDAIVIRGQKSPDGVDTLIKFGRDTLAEVTIGTSPSQAGKLRVSLGSGDDFLRITDMVIDGQFQYTGGSGGDSLGINDSIFSGPMNWNSGSGNDAIIINESNFHDSVIVKTGNGADWIAMNGGTSDGALINLNTGGGPDLVSFEDTIIDSEVLILTGGFPDELYLGSGATFNAAVNIDLGTYADALMVEHGVVFNDLDNVVISANKRGPNYENALFMEVGVDTNTLPDLSTFQLVFDNASNLYEEFEFRLGNINVNLEFLDSLKTLLHRRGFEFSEMPIDSSTLTSEKMDALAAAILAGLESNETLERILFESIFEDDFV